MATVSYTFVSRCNGGGHTVLDVSYNGAAAQRIVYATDELLLPLSSLTQEQRELYALLTLKIHMAGKTRAQVVTEFASPVTVTI